jgi:tight adherence protein B
MLTFAFILVLFVSLTTLLLATRAKAEPKLLRKRLRIIESYGQVAQAEGKLFELEDTPERTISSRIGEYLERYPISRRLQTLILHSGSEMTVGSLVLISVAISLGLLLVTGLFFHLLPVQLVAGAIGLWAPYALLGFKRSRRVKKFNVALPDAMNLMARSLRAGHSISSAIEIIAEQSPEPLASEFARVFQQQKFGLRFRDAMLELGDRIPSTDLQFLITAILVQKETGGDLIDILDRTTEVIRDRIRIEGEVRTKTAQGRLTGWILSLLPVVLLLIINLVNPGYSSLLFQDPIGRVALYIGGGLMCVGAFVISKIVKVEV